MYTTNRMNQDYDLGAWLTAAVAAIASVVTLLNQWRTNRRQDTIERSALRREETREAQAVKRDEFALLREQLTLMQGEIKDLKSENAKLHDDLSVTRLALTAAQSEAAQLKAHIGGLEKILERTIADDKARQLVVAQLQVDKAHLAGEVESLRQQLRAEQVRGSERDVEIARIKKRTDPLPPLE